MANTITTTTRNIEGDLATTLGTVAFSGTYATGGEAVTAAQLGLTTIADIELDVTSLSATTNIAVWSPSTAKIILVAPAGTQVANGTSLTGITAKFKAVGA